MLHLVDVLWPYIVILYVADSITYIRANHWLFVSHFGKTFKLKTSGFRLLSISPIGQAFISNKLPIWLTKKGIYVPPNEPSETDRIYSSKDCCFISYDDMAKVASEGKGVRINGEEVSKTASPITARHLAGLIWEVRGTSVSKRLEKIKAFLAETTDLHQIKGLRKRHSDVLSWLGALSSSLFLITFVLLLLNLHFFTHAHLSLELLVIYLGVIYLVTLIVTYSLHRRIYCLKIGETIYEILSLLLLPVAAIHALNYLTKDMYARFDYLAVAAEFLPTKHFHELMRKELYRLDYIMAREKNRELLEFWQMRKSSLRGLLANAGVCAQEIQVTSPKKDDAAFSYCPMCGTDYRSGFYTCNDCGAELKAY